MINWIEKMTVDDLKKVKSFLDSINNSHTWEDLKNDPDLAVLFFDKESYLVLGDLVVGGVWIFSKGRYAYVTCELRQWKAAIAVNKDELGWPKEKKAANHLYFS